MNSLFSLLVLGVCGIAIECAWVKDMENSGLWQGDIVLDPDEIDQNATLQFASVKGKRWPGGKIPYVIHNSIKEGGINAINEAIQDYHKYTCLRLHPRTTESSYLLFFRGEGCSSPVGYRKGRVNQVSLAQGCWYKAVVMHEIGHSLGLFHEQSRPDRDEYVRILWDNIPEDRKFNFKKFTYKKIDSLGTPYDYLSLMHYGSTAFGIKGRQTIQTIDPSKEGLIGQRRGLSETDMIQLGRMYNNCQDATTTAPTTIAPTTTTTTAKTGGVSSGDCQDEHSDCKSWARNGDCKGDYGHGPWMRAHCCRSCKGYGH